MRNTQKGLVYFLIFALFFSGCRLRSRDWTGLRSGNSSQSLTVNGLERSYILHTPPALLQGEKLPLIIVLHGTYGTGRKMQLGLGFDPYADERSFYVAYPDAYQEPGSRQTARWNDGRETLESSELGIDDVAFLLAMIEDIGSTVPLDTNRVYVTGASNGGMMTYRLGCETAGVFAGIAPVIGNIPLPIAASCSPSAPLDFLAINGDADSFVPFSGGEVCQDVERGCEGGFVLSVADSIAAFAAADGCSPDPQRESLPVEVEDGTFIERWNYPGCLGNVQVQGIIVRNGGHTWPPRRGQIAASGQETGNLDATDIIVDFFFP
jgi:polyhydroxybutyrate depolymerase